MYIGEWAAGFCCRTSEMVDCKCDRGPSDVVSPGVLSPGGFAYESEVEMSLTRQQMRRRRIKMMMNLMSPRPGDLLVTCSL